MTPWGPSGRALVAWLLLALGTPSAAEEAGGVAVAAEPEVIAIGQIAAQAQALEVTLRGIGAERSPQEDQRLEAQLQSIADRRAAAAERLESMLARRYAPSELEALATSWRGLDRELKQLEGQVGARADALDAQAAEIAEQTELWKRTRAAASRSAAPEAVLRQIDQALGALGAADRKLEPPLSRVVELEQRVEQLRLAVGPSMQRLEAAKTALAVSLFERQDAPLWESLPDLAAMVAAPSKVGESLAGILAELRDYADRYSDRLVIHVLLFLVLGWAFTRARAARARRLKEGAGPTFDPLRHPWSAAFLVAVLLAPLVQPMRVRGYQLIVFPVAFVAWFRVVGGMLSPALRGPLLGLALLALVSLVRAVVVELQLVSRMLLIAELIVVLAGVVWLRRPERLQYVPWREARGLWLRAVDGWMRIAAPAVGVGLVSALLGYTNLADRIATLAIWGSIGGAAWVAVVQITEAIAENVVEQGRLDRLRSVRSDRLAFLALLRRVTRGLVVLLWAYTTLASAGLWSPVRDGLGSLLSGSVGYGPVSISLGGVVAFGLTLWISWLLARFVSVVLDQEVFSRVRTPPGVPFAVSTFTRYAILVVGFVLAMGTVGFSLDRVTLMLSAVGVGIGFGLQNLVNNFVSGALLLFERPIRVGDQVQIEDLLGLVTSIGLRASKVRTFDGSEVIVPNSDFISGRVVNWTLSDRKRRVILPVGVAYGTPPRRVIELLGEMARAHPEVLAEPAPVVLFRGFGDSSLDFEIRAWTEGDWVAVMSDLAVATSEALEAAGISIPFPQRDLHLRNIPELRDALREVAGSARADSDVR
jgi:small-conductance mechanosensitive channel